MRPTALAATTALLASTVASTSPALAASVHYAAPGGSGSACTQASPCSLHMAVSVASDGDTIQLTADEYVLRSPLDIWRDNLTIAGPAGIAGPSDFKAFIIFPAQADGGLPDNERKIVLGGNNIRFERVAVTGRADAGALISRGAGASGSSFDRVWLRNTGDGDTVGGTNVTMTNSVVMHEGSSLSAAVTFNGTISGSTIYSRNGTALLQSGGYLRSPGCNTTIRNTIAWGGRSNLTVDNTGGDCPSLNVDVDYSWIPSADAGGGIVGPVTAGVHNLPDLPALFTPTDPADSYLSSLELPPGSPAVDAGCTGGPCGSHDYYGRPRPIGDRNDIGAMEQALPPQFGTIMASAITSTSAGVASTVRPLGATTSYSLQYRPTGSSAWTNAITQTLSADLFGSHPVDVTLTDLSPSTYYDVRMVGNNERGTSTGPIQTLRTAPETLPVPAVTLRGLRAKVTKRKARLLSTATTTVPGTLGQRATTATQTACRTPSRFVLATTINLRCQLSKKVRKQLRKKKIRLTVVTTLQPTLGPAVSTTQRLTLRRTR